MWPQVLQKCSQNKINTFNWKGKTSWFPLSTLGSEWLKDGKLLGRDKMSKEFCTNYDSSSANNNAHPAMPLHSVYKQSCLTAFSATSHLRSACFIVVPWVPASCAWRPTPQLFPGCRAQSQEAEEAGTCSPRWLPHASRPTESGPGSRSHWHLLETPQNAVTPLLCKSPCENASLQIMWPCWCSLKQVCNEIKCRERENGGCSQEAKCTAFWQQYSCIYLLAHVLKDLLLASES